jgi:hypothetical protein
MVSKVKDTEYRHDITGHLVPVHVEGMRVSNKRDMIYLGLASAQTRNAILNDYDETGYLRWW